MLRFLGICQYILLAVTFPMMALEPLGKLS